MFVSEFIVGTHYRPYLSFFYGSFEGWQINFVQSTIADMNIDMASPQFLIVECKMFYAGSYTILLNSLYVRNHHA